MKQVADSPGKEGDISETDWKSLNRQNRNKISNALVEWLELPSSFRKATYTKKYYIEKFEPLKFHFLGLVLYIPKDLNQFQPIRLLSTLSKYFLGDENFKTVYLK